MTAVILTKLEESFMSNEGLVLEERKALAGSKHKKLTIAVVREIEEAGNIDLAMNHYLFEDEKLVQEYIKGIEHGFLGIADEMIFHDAFILGYEDLTKNGGTHFYNSLAGIFFKYDDKGVKDKVTAVFIPADLDLDTLIRDNIKLLKKKFGLAGTRLLNIPKNQINIFPNVRVIL